MNGISRNLVVITAVLALHVAAVWALNAGLRADVVEVLVPVQLSAQLIKPPRPVADMPAVPVVPAPPPSPPSPKSTPEPEKVASRKAAAKPVPIRPSKQVPVPAAVAVPSPVTLAVDATPSPNAATALNAPNSAPKGEPVTAPAAVAIDAPRVAAAPAAAPPTPPVPIAIEMPSSDARYLQNPKPRYPAISRRLGEQGTVQIQVLVSDKGVAKDVRIQSSSGFSRLDNAALASVLTWRFVPGKRAGVAESMWFTVPITFGLE